MPNPGQEPIDTANQPDELLNMLKREEGDEKTYAPDTTAANYDPTNTTNPQNQQYLRGEQGYAPPSANRSEGYTYKSDQEFVAQHDAEQDQAMEQLRANSPTIGRAHQRDALNLHGPDTERRAAVGPEGTGKDEA